jgi:hypothetical protein
MLELCEAKFLNPSDLEALMVPDCFGLRDIVPAFCLTDMEDRLDYAISGVERGKLIHGLDFFIELKECIYYKMVCDERFRETSPTFEGMNQSLVALNQKLVDSGLFERDGENGDFAYFLSKGDDTPSKDDVGSTPKVYLSLSLSQKMRFQEATEGLYAALTTNANLISQFKYAANENSFLRRRESVVAYPIDLGAAHRLVDRLRGDRSIAMEVELGFDFTKDDITWSWRERHAMVAALLAFEELFGVCLCELLSEMGTPIEVGKEEQLMRVNMWLQADPFFSRYAQRRSESGAVSLRLPS